MKFADHDKFLTRVGKKEKSDRIFKPTGFTLPELLIAILLFTIIIGVGVARFRHLNQRKQVETAAKQIEQAIRETQKRASAGVKPYGWCDDPGDVLEGYSINLGSPSVIQYQIFSDCSDDSEDTLTTYDLGLGAEINNMLTINFDLLGRSDVNATVCIRDPDNLFFYQISVTIGGSVSFTKTASC